METMMSSLNCYWFPHRKIPMEPPKEGKLMDSNGSYTESEQGDHTDALETLEENTDPLVDLDDAVASSELATHDASDRPCIRNTMTLFQDLETEFCNHEGPVLEIGVECDSRIRHAFDNYLEETADRAKKRKFCDQDNLDQGGS
jgi:hypothetical protein